MAIRVYDTLTKTKHPFEPLNPPQVGMYLCGPTVYKPSHIGHMVGPVIFDAVKRYLVYNDYQVTFVINVTDVDDKLINEAAQRKMSMPELAREMTADYMQNLEAMGVDTVDHFPHATENMDEIIRFTQELIDKGFAYEADGGDVYFDVGKDADYGKLSHRSLDALRGEGGEMVERKRSAADFALWKGAKPGEPSWESPWGPGRPGWHIECSAMSRRILGPSFDIHGGGLDLVFPHHENEIAQSECAHGKPQAKYWMHNGLMQAADEVGKVGGRNTRTAEEGDQAAQEAGKLGKSKGASAFRDLLKTYTPETIRFFLLSTQYRRPIYFGPDRLAEVETSLETFYRYFKRFERVAGQAFYELPYRRRREEAAPLADELAEQLAGADRQRFLEAMDDDFNTGGAIGILFDLVRTLNKFIEEHKLESTPRPEQVATLKAATSILRELTSLLGLFRQPVASGGGGGDDELVGKLMSLLIELRAEARQTKNFALADKIRLALGEMQIVLEDRPTGTEWTVQR